MMKTIRFSALFFSFTLILYAFTTEARADSFLPFPNADQLAGPIFIQPSAGLAVISESNEVERNHSSPIYPTASCREIELSIY